MPIIIKLSNQEAHEMAMKLGRVDVKKRDWEDANLSYRFYCNQLFVRNNVPLNREITRIDFDRKVLEISDIEVPVAAARTSPEGVEVVGSVSKKEEGVGEVGEKTEPKPDPMEKTPTKSWKKKKKK